MLPDLFRRLKPLFGEQIDRAWIAFQLGTKEDRQEIETALTILALRRQGIAIGNERIVLEPPLAALAGRGHLLLGYVEYPGLVPYPVCLDRSELLRHVFLLGPSGTGKSTFIIGILRQLLAQQVTFWCIDFKRNYRCLIADEHGRGVVVLSVGRNLAPLRVNMLHPPPGVATNEWVEALSDLISTAYLLMQGARNVLKTALLGAINTPHGTLRDARDLLANELATSRSGSRRYGWMESSYRALDELTKEALGDAFCAKQPIAVEKLLLLPTVFELQGLGDDQKRCVCLYFLQWLLLHRKYEAGERETLKHVLIFDEAQNVFPKDQWGELGLPSKLAREIREYGEAIISATQQADVADSLIANSGTKIILRTDHPKDVDFSSRLLQVDARWITKIPTGHAMVRLPTRYFQAFLLSFPEQPLKNRLVTDQAVQDRYTQWQTAREVSDELHALRSGAATVASPEASELSLDAISAKEEQLLADVAQFPISTVTERYTRLGWNPKTGTIVKDRLLRQGLLVFTVVSTGHSRVMILALTDAGATEARTHGVAVAVSGPGGVEHEFWRARLRERCERRGYTVTSEHLLSSGGRVDLHATNGTQTFLLEIETGKSDVGRNIAKCAKAPGRLIVFFTSDTAREEARISDPRVVVLSPLTLDQLHGLLSGFPTDKAPGG